MSGVFGPENVPVGQSVDFKKRATRLALSFAGTLWANPRLEKRISNKTRTSPIPSQTFRGRQPGLFLIRIRSRLFCTSIPIRADKAVRTADLRTGWGRLVP